MAVLEAMFVLNIIFFVLFVLAVFHAVRSLYPSAAPGVALLLLLSGTCASAFMGLTDTGLFLLLLAGLLLAIASARPWLASVLLALTAWTRPEGALVAAGLLFGAIRLRMRHVFRAWQWLVCAGIGAVLAAYFAFRSDWGGSSRSLPVVWTSWIDAVGAHGAYARGLMVLAKVLMRDSFGIGPTPLTAATIPVLGGLLAILGLCAAEWESDERTRPLLGGLLLAGFASWFVGLFADRTAVSFHVPPWFLAVWVAAVGFGARRLADFVSNRRYVYPVLLAFLLGYECAAMPNVLRSYAANCASTQALVRFLREQCREWRPGTSIGLMSDEGLGYLLPEYVVRPAIDRKHPLLADLRNPGFAIEVYKHHPEVRFDFWLLRSTELSAPLVEHSLGERIGTPSDNLPTAHAQWALYKAVWTNFIVSASPAASHVCSAVASNRLIAQLDVGYPPHERDLRYRVHSRLPSTEFAPFVATRRIGEHRLVDAGAMVIGADEFSLPVVPGRGLRIVMRTTSRAQIGVAQSDGYYANEQFSFRSPLRILAEINGRLLPEPIQLEIDPDVESFSEVVLDIPAEYVTGDRANIRLLGDHIACAYWFYQ